MLTHDKLLGIYNSERISYRKSLHERESVRERAIEQIRIETARKQCRGSYTNTITNRYTVVLTHAQILYKYMGETKADIGA